MGRSFRRHLDWSIMGSKVLTKAYELQLSDGEFVAAEHVGRELRKMYHRGYDTGAQSRRRREHYGGGQKKGQPTRGQRVAGIK